MDCMKNLLLVLILSIVSCSEVYAWDKNKSIGSPDLDASAIFQVNTTEKGSIACPKMTLVERDLISAPVVGLCIFNTTTQNLETYSGSSWKLSAQMQAWLTSTTYEVGNIVHESDKIYRSLTAHTSTVFATDLANSDWKELSDDLNRESSSTDTAIVIWDGITGDNVKDTSVLIDASSNITGVNDITSGGIISSLQMAAAEFFGDFFNFTQITTPTTPLAGENKIYFKADGKMYQLDEFGNEKQIGGDSIRDFVYGEDIAAGDAIQIFSDGGVPSVKKLLVDGIASDGSAWTLESASHSDNWQSVTYGLGLFVSVSANNGAGTDRVMTSPDGLAWTAQVTPSASAWDDITFGNGLFVAVSSNGTSSGQMIMTSADAINWTLRNTPIDTAWVGITNGNGLFLAVARDSQSVMISSDGISWTAHVSAANNTWRNAAYGNSTFVVIGEAGGSNQAMTSPDGVSWTLRGTPLSNINWQGLAFGNGIFVATSAGGVNTSSVMTSPDGITWTLRTVPVARTWDEVIFGNGIFIAIERGAGGKVMTSSDGITWVEYDVAQADQWIGLAADGNSFVAVGAGVSTMLSVGIGPTTQLDKYYGIAQTTALSGTSNEVALPVQVSAVHSGKTAGEIAYLQPDGTIGATVSEFFAGVYLSDTELKVDKNPKTASGESGGTPVDLVKFQTKTLSGNTSTTGEVASLTFNNLTIGNTYRLSGQIRTQSLAFSDVSRNFNMKLYNGILLVNVGIKRDASGTNQEWVDTVGFIHVFIASDAKLHWDITTAINTKLFQDGGGKYTYMTLEELPYHLETTDFN